MNVDEIRDVLRLTGAETGRKSIKNIKITGLTSYVRPVFVKNMKKALFIISSKAEGKVFIEEVNEGEKL